MKEKLDKISVNYTDYAKYHNERCELCKHFKYTRPEARRGTCNIIEGIIAAEGWCKRFERKTHP